MASQYSFDIVSKVDMPELTNAVNQTLKEIAQRFDFKGSISNVELAEGKLILTSDDEYKLKNLKDVLEGKLVKRGVSLKFFDYQKVEPALGGAVKQEVLLKQGITREKAKEIIEKIKGSGLKVQSQIQGEDIRISSKSKDDLQGTIQALKGTDFGIVLQFVNYR